MGLETTRRSLITGLIAFVAAPAIVRAGSLMPIKVMEEQVIFPVLQPDVVFMATLNDCYYFFDGARVHLSVRGWISDQWFDRETPKPVNKWDTRQAPDI